VTKKLYHISVKIASIFLAAIIVFAF